MLHLLFIDCKTCSLSLLHSDSDSDSDSGVVGVVLVLHSDSDSGGVVLVLLSVSVGLSWLVLACLAFSFVVCGRFAILSLVCHLPFTVYHVVMGWCQVL